MASMNRPGPTFRQATFAWWNADYWTWLLRLNLIIVTFFVGFGVGVFWMMS